MLREHIPNHAEHFHLVSQAYIALMNRIIMTMIAVQMNHRFNAIALYAS
jgi:hypothetical protein